MNHPANNPKSITIHSQSDDTYSIGNLCTLLTEITTLLEKFAVLGKTGMIDLNSLPFSSGEYEHLRQLLGQGEVTARIESIGPSEIIETRYPGVWWVTHYNVEGDIVADMIEITDFPGILKSQPSEISEALERLKAQLDEEVPS